MSWTMWKVLSTVPLLYALSWSPVEWHAQDLKSVDEGVITTEVVSPKMEEKKVDTIDWGTAIQWTSVRDLEWALGWDEEKKSDTGWDQWWEKKESKIWVHWLAQVWTWVAWDFAIVCSDKAALTTVLDVSHKSTWLWFTVVRLDDFHNDPDQPASRATVLNTHWSKKFGKDWKIWLNVDWKYTFLDHMPDGNGFTPDIVWSYTTDKWRTFEWMYAHKFKKWKDSDAFRLGITKKITEALTFIAQWWYETGYDRDFYGRVIVNFDIWNGLMLQFSCIDKDGKLTPTSWVIFQF